MTATRYTAMTVIAAVIAMVFATASAYGMDAGAAPAEVEETPAKSLEPTAVAEDPIGTVTEVVNDVKAGDWRHAIAGMLALLMLALSKVRGKIKFFEGDRGGAVLVGVLGIAGAFSTLLASDATMDWRLFAGAFGVTFTAVGGYTWVKQILWPRDQQPAPKPAAEVVTE